MITLVKWIFVHLVVDFLAQSRSMVHHKRDKGARSWFLYLHCLLHGGLVYLVTASWQLWQVPLLVVITHFIIDLWKLNRPDKLVYFIIDQALHLLVLFALWSIYISPAGWYAQAWSFLSTNPDVWLIGTGYLAVTFPLSILLSYATKRWRVSLEKGEWHGLNSLSDAGKWIGIFERLLVFTFVITSHYEGIGFLIAAKSVLRFNDIKGSEARKETEYVLIGTLMSFALSILTGLIVRTGLQAL
jgi:hypothetical protein